MRYILALPALCGLTLLVSAHHADHHLPDPRLTPGAFSPAVTQQTLRATICRRGYTASVRPPVAFTDALKRKQLADPRYGYSDRDPKHYEEDHRVPLELGGAPRDPANLWPEPYAGPHGAHDKDALENATHRRLCAGSITLAQARATFTRPDWTRAQ